MAKRRIQKEQSRQSGGSEAPELVALTGELAEFRKALREEVDAATKASSSNAIPISSGVRLGSLGDGFQYRFDVDAKLDLPGDTPGQLEQPGQAPVQVAVIGFEGLTVIINSVKDLGTFVPKAHLTSDLSMLLVKLIERIESKATASNPAGDRLLGERLPAGECEHVTNDQLALPEGTALNAEQLAAVGSALGRDTTYIWGPPGTGKTLTIGAIGAELHKRGRTLLVVSHTNTAVDEALRKIADAIGRTEEGRKAIFEGEIIRVGTPKGEQFGAEPYRSMLLSEQRERRSVTYAGRKAALSEEKGILQGQDSELAGRINVHDFIAESAPDVVRIQGEQFALESLRARIAMHQSKVDELAIVETANAEVLTEAEQAASMQVRDRDIEITLVELAGRKRLIETDFAACASQLEELRANLEVADRLQSTRDQIAMCPSLDSLRERYAVARATRIESDRDHSNREVQHAAEKSLLERTERASWVVRQLKGLPDPAAQAVAVARSAEALSVARAAVAAAAEGVMDAASEVSRVEELEAIVQLCMNLPPRQVIQEAIAEASTRGDQLRQRLDGCDAECNEFVEERSLLGAVVNQFRDARGCLPAEFLAKVHATTTERQACQEAGKRDRDAENAAHQRIQAELVSKLDRLRSFGIVTVAAESEGDLLNVFIKGLEKASESVAGSSKVEVEREREKLAVRRRAISAELSEIEEVLRGLEDGVIRSARIVGATLTSAFLRETIQNRRFDTVLLDEASMAPIPAVWVAASLCDRALVIVGDYKQLPPVVISEKDHATKWLGRDPFEIANLVDPSPEPSHFVALLQQHRMHPDISRIVNEHFYGHKLRDDQQMGSRGIPTSVPWMSADWTLNETVLLVDTGPLHAWVTCVPRGPGSSSRLNFMSATVCADIAATLLGQTDTSSNQGNKPRILIVSPYRPHSKLVSLLINHEGLTAAVSAGTSHSVQGSEADVVILDLVNDEPHMRVGHFAPKRDESTKRLFNVSITRAKKRLIVVGDFAYYRKHGAKAFLGGTLIPYLLKEFKTVSALSVVPEGLAARAAAARAQIIGGPVEPSASRIVVVQSDFDPLFFRDCRAAKQRIVIYSPFITRNRVSDVQTALKAAIERGVEVVVVTKTLENRKTREAMEYSKLERGLREWGVRVVHKHEMHEKLVLIDSAITWTGSLNVLSFAGGTQEIMERRESEEVFKAYEKTLLLSKFLVHLPKGITECPLCGMEVIAAEGAHTAVYFRCSSEKCKFRCDVDEHAVLRGDVRCSKCGGAVHLIESDVGGPSRWSCDTTPHHKQLLVKAIHLRLPKVRKRLGEGLIAKLEGQFAQRRKNGADDGQSLFDGSVGHANDGSSGTGMGKPKDSRLGPPGKKADGESLFGGLFS